MPRLVATCVLALIAFTLSAEAVLVLRPKLNDLDLWNDEKILNHTISLDNDIPGINITIEVFQDILDVDFTITLKVIEETTPQYYVSGTIAQNMCYLLANSELPLSLSVLRFIKSFALIFDKCPIEKGHYFIHDFWFDEVAASEDSPQKPFRIDLDVAATMPNGLRVPVIRDDIIGVNVLKTVDKLYTK